METSEGNIFPRAVLVDFAENFGNYSSIFGIEEESKESVE